MLLGNDFFSFLHLYSINEFVGNIDRSDWSDENASSARHSFFEKSFLVVYGKECFSFIERGKKGD